MKNTGTLSIDRSRILLYLFFIITCSVFLVSWEKEEMQHSEAAALAVVQPNADLKPAKKKGAPAPGDASIAAIAIEGGFTELVSALTYVDGELDAGLVELFLNGTDQYTVFAPTNDAFQLLYDTLGIYGIRDLPAPLVLDVLLYHVIEGRRAANSVVPSQNYRTIQTLSGASFKVDPQGKITAIGSSANIETPDISASNGIIHVIDEVLLPIN